MEVDLVVKDNADRKAYQKQYHANRYATDEEFRKRVAESGVRRRAEIIAIISIFKKNGCSMCDEKDSVCLQAHHIDPKSKDFNIAYALRNKFKPSVVINELQKCICLCANCHFKLHAGVLLIE